MTRAGVICGLFAVLAGAPAARAEVAPAPDAPIRVRRFALIIGSNDGGRERLPLRYALTDAESVVRVFSELGGVAPEDRIFLRNPDIATVRASFGGLSRMIQTARAAPDGAATRVEVVFYYSGHSDEEGLLPGGNMVPYGEVRAALDALKADVRVGIVDSCSSGALTRSKGGVRRAPFLVDAGSNVKGYAILTSAAADEAAQESDRLGGSFFTLSLVSGLRGAADARGDGRVTLNEAYQFAFDETLARTEKTVGGAQHPAYDIQLAGSGDLIITDLRSNTARLRIADDIEGRLYVRDIEGRLAAELGKRAGHPLELALEPGDYAVIVASGTVRMGANVHVAEGREAELVSSKLRMMPAEPTVSRGGSTFTADDMRVRPPSTEAVAPPSDGPREPLVKRLATAVARELRDEIPEIPPLPFVGSEPPRPEPVIPPPPPAPEKPAAEGTLRTTGFVFSIFPGVSIPRRASERTVHVSVGVPISRVGRVEGASTNLIAGFSGPVFGAQVATVLVGAGAVKGVQAASVAAIATGPLDGVQLSGLMSTAGGPVRGLQASSGLTISHGGAGIQAGLLNIAAGDFSGIQAGLLNISSGKVAGMQVGLVNVSEDIAGLPVGLVSIARAQPVRPGFWTGSQAPFNFGMQFGSRYVYNVLALSTGAPGTRARWDGQWRLSVGLGIHIPIGRFWLETDGMLQLATTEQSDEAQRRAQVRFLAGWQAFSRLALYAGLTADVAVQPPPIDVEPPQDDVGTEQSAATPGYVLGIRF